MNSNPNPARKGRCRPQCGLTRDARGSYVLPSSRYHPQMLGPATGVSPQRRNRRLSRPLAGVGKSPMDRAAPALDGDRGEIDLWRATNNQRPPTTAIVPVPSWVGTDGLPPSEAPTTNIHLQFCPPLARELCDRSSSSSSNRSACTIFFSIVRVDAARFADISRWHCPSTVSTTR
jgi:hypothetical protein